MKKGYQKNYSLIQHDAVHNIESRLRKADTILTVLYDYYQGNIENLDILDIGASTGIIDNFLADYFHTVIGADIDEPAINFARESFSKPNLKFIISDAMNIDKEDNCFDIILCSHVYEHVPDQIRLMNEIHRLLKTGGICYFSAGNRIRINEPHYNLPFLSLLPQSLANVYLRLMGKGSNYYEEHRTYWGLKQLVNKFKIHDYTKIIINNPEKYKVNYILPDNSLKLKTARFISEYIYWLVPGYIWLLEKV